MIQFLHPLALLGLIAAATPLVIYWLLRRRKTEVPWGASYLLRLTLTTRRRSSVWRQYVVLAVRCLILGLFGFLIAQPLLPRARPDPAIPQSPTGPVHRAILLDNTFSMSLREEAGSRLERMRRAVAALLSAQRPWDRATLIPLRAADTNREIVALAGRLRPAGIRAAVSGIRLREGTLDLTPPLSEALVRLARTPGVEQELFILSDFPRELADEIAGLSWFRQAAEERKVRVVAVNLAGSGIAGAAGLRGLSLGSDLVVAGVPVNLYADVENDSDSAAAPALAVTRDGREVAAERIGLQPNERKTIAIAVTFTNAGVSVIHVSLGQALLDVDTRMSLSVEVRAAPRVWLASEGPVSAGETGEAYFFQRAFGRNGNGAPLFTIEPAEVRALSLPIPENVDVIVVAGAPLAPTVAEPLLAFVRRGGGLIVTMAPGVSRTAYNEALAALLPAPFESLWTDAVEPLTFASIRPLPRPGSSPLFEEFGTDRNGSLADVRFYNYVRVAGWEDAPGVVFELNTGDPILLHRGVGRGHVYVLASSLGISWSSLAVQQTHVPFLSRLMEAAMAGRGVARNLDPGRTFAAPWPRTARVTLSTPEREERPAGLVLGRGNAAFGEVEAPPQRGLYTLRGDGGHLDTFTVKGAFPEGDLRTVSAPQAEGLVAALGSPIYPAWERAVTAIGVRDRLRAMWPALLALMLALYFFEAWFVRSL